MRREFEVLEMKETKTIIGYFSRVMVVTNKMRSNGEDMPELKMEEKILWTLVKRFTYVVVSIKESKDTKAMSIDELQSSLVVREQKFKRSSRGGEQALKVERSTGWERGTYQGRRYGRRRQSFSKATMECFEYHNLGHFQYECPKWNKESNYV